MKNELTAKRIQLALSNSNMRSQDLADKSGIGKASISQYVNGSHAPGNISAQRMGEVLNVNPLWLMGFDAPMNPECTKKDKSPEILHYYNLLNDIEKHVATEKIKELTEVSRYGEKESTTKLDKRLQKIIHCYDEMDDMGRESLADQADYLLGKHPRAKEKEEREGNLIYTDIWKRKD